MEEIGVSICCLAYNQENYIRRCLDGFLMQKTNFKFEVLIHDDASTDKTADIIREYEQKYPDIIKPIYQKENQYSQHKKINWTYQYPRVKGKYIAWCEGDDCWTDEYKLQKQFDALENNPDCSFCAHKVEKADTDGITLNEFFPRSSADDIFDKLIIPNDKLIEYIFTKDEYPFQTSSYFIKSEYIKECIGNRPAFMTKAVSGDFLLLLLCISKGNVYYIDDAMSNYTVNRPGSWSEQYSDVGVRIKILKNAADCVSRFNNYTGSKYENYTNYYITKNKFTVKRFEKDYKAMISPEYKVVFSELPLKTKLHIRIFAYFPFLIPVINKIFKKD